MAGTPGQPAGQAPTGHLPGGHLPNANPADAPTIKVPVRDTVRVDLFNQQIVHVRAA